MTDEVRLAAPLKVIDAYFEMTLREHELEFLESMDLGELIEWTRWCAGEMGWCESKERGDFIPRADSQWRIL